ncbi:MAG: response regulator [candidate division Zixibacteria bacterium]|nr:response regulator [candidate division Zixibacteria bacterium]
MDDTEIKILVVDDDQYILSLLIDTLKAIGYDSVGAVDGIEALEKLKQDTYNLVITDIKMPRMGGVELLTKIRKIYPGLPVLYITGVASPEIISEIVPNGFLTKPFRISQIETLIKNTLAPQKYSNPGNVKKVMIVDDDDAFREMMVESLNVYEFKTIAVADGIEALNTLENESVDAVITDMKMPYMDGITLLKKIKEIHPEIPTIVITAYLSDDEVKSNLINFSADGFFEKPFDMEQIVNLLKKI